MKKLKRLTKHFLTLFLMGLVVLTFNNCNDDTDDFILPEFATVVEYTPWQDFLSQLDLTSNIVIVQKDESIQEAIDEASAGDKIYIEPGNYQQKFSTDKAEVNISLISLEPDDLKNNNIMDKSINIIKLYDERSLGNNYNRSEYQKKSNLLRNFKKTNLDQDIVHYQFEISVGEGEFDWVRIHRVVRENSPFQPVATTGDIIMIHGAIQDFDDIFFTAGSEVINEKTSSPFYLASNNLDVWGIDMGWTMVPMETQDFSFMEGWGIEKDVDHTLKALSIIRLLRGVSHQGFDRINLLGFSYSASVIYGAANKETQEHRIWRDIKGLIPVDSFLKSENENMQIDACSSVERIQKKLNNGLYVHPWGVGFIQLAALTLNSPDGFEICEQVNPFGLSDCNLTNSQYYELLGTYGFFAGDQGKLLYTDPLRFFRMGVNLAPYWPRQIPYDTNACMCPSANVSYDDHLGEISVPILNISAGGGSNVFMTYTSSLTASKDITDQMVTGYGHADLWMAYDADIHVWNNLRQWLLNHN